MGGEENEASSLGLSYFRIDLATGGDNGSSLPFRLLMSEHWLCFWSWPVLRVGSVLCAR